MVDLARFADSCQDAPLRFVCRERILMVYAWDAAIAAGLEPQDGNKYRSNGRPADMPANYGMDTASVSMVWRMRRRLGDNGIPLLQFVRCAEVAAGRGAILAFARASATQFGRTLLINARRRVNAEPVPDAFVRRLYHQDLAGPNLCALLSKSIDAEGRIAGAFHSIVIDQESLSMGEAACAAAPLCCGTILLVQAGRTRLQDILATAQRVSAVGGAVLGTLLVGGEQRQFNGG